MLVDPIQHHGVPHQAVFLFEHPMVFVRKGQEAGWDAAFLEDVEGGESFATDVGKCCSALGICDTMFKRKGKKRKENVPDR